MFIFSQSKQIKWTIMAGWKNMQFVHKSNITADCLNISRKYCSPPFWRQVFFYFAVLKNPKLFYKHFVICNCYYRFLEIYFNLKSGYERHGILSCKTMQKATCVTYIQVPLWHSRFYLYFLFNLWHFISCFICLYM